MASTPCVPCASPLYFQNFTGMTYCFNTTTCQYGDAVKPTPSTDAVCAGPAASTSASSSATTGIAVGAAIGGVMLLILLVLVALLLVRRRRVRPKTDRNTVAFSNPLYEGAVAGEPVTYNEAGGHDEGLYDQPAANMGGDVSKSNPIYDGGDGGDGQFEGFGEPDAEGEEGAGYLDVNDE
jgi:hypothetical protein